MLLRYTGSAAVRMPCDQLAGEKDGDEESLQELWGKTATVIDGTNVPKSYGLFIGGCGDKGIVALVRKGNGNLAGRWARRLLNK